MRGTLLAAPFLSGAPSLAEGSGHPDDSYSRPQVDGWACFETLTGVQAPGKRVERLAD